MPNDINNNNMDYYLISSLREMSYRQRVATLEIEIAKANDPATRQRLQNLLDKTVNEHNKKSNGLFIVMVIMLILIVGIASYIFFWYLPSTSTSNASPTSVAPAVSSTQTSDTLIQTEQQNTNNEINRTNAETNEITVEQFKKWVAKVWDEKHPTGNESNLLNNPNLSLTTSIDSEGYATANIAIVQSDTIDMYRINSRNELEESAFFAGEHVSPLENRWVLVESKIPSDL